MGRVLVFLLVCFVRVRAPAAEESFDWPLPLAHALSSTFGETRAAAFHAGIDLKTWGRSGYAVRAVAPGWAWRARTSPWGYGRALYQKLDDGRIVVYAHLESFAPPIAARVRRAQRRQGRYSVDIWFEEGEVVLRRGQVIARSGASGAGPPHLHLELRDAENVPINPLLHGFEVKDTTPPTPQALALIPFGPGSTVGGEREPVVLGLRWSRESGYFEAGETPGVQGRIGVALLAYDRADGAPNKLAPLEAALRVDGRRLSSTRFARVAYGDAHQVLLERTWLPRGEGGRPFFNLFRSAGERLEFCRVARGGKGLLRCAVEGGLQKGLHELVVEVGDAAGNSSRARLRLRAAAPPHLERARLLREEGGLSFAAVLAEGDDEEVELAWSAQGGVWKPVGRRRVRPAAGPFTWVLPPGGPLWRLRVLDGAGGGAFVICGLPGDPGAGERLVLERRVFSEFVDLHIRSESLLRAPPMVRLGEGAPFAARQVGLKEYRAALPLGQGALVRVRGRSLGGTELRAQMRLSQQRAAPGREARLVFLGGAAALVFGAHSAYEPFFPQVEAFTPAPPPPLGAVGAAYAFGPEGMAFDRKVGVFLRYPEGVQRPEKLALYREVGEGRWVFVGNEREAERRVGARVRTLSRFALLRDEEAPTIAGLQPAPGAVLKERRPRLRAHIEDRGSGLGREEDLAVELDGRRLISEYDPEAHTLEGRLEEDLSPGAHTLVVQARDMSGNQAAARSEFRLR